MDVVKTKPESIDQPLRDRKRLNDLERDSGASRNCCHELARNDFRYLRTRRRRPEEMSKSTVWIRNNSNNFDEIVGYIGPDRGCRHPHPWKLCLFLVCSVCRILATYFPHIHAVERTSCIVLVCIFSIVEDKENFWEMIMSWKKCYSAVEKWERGLGTFRSRLSKVK